MPIPHYDMKARTKSINEIKAKYSKDFDLVLLTDDQAIVVNDAEWKIVESKRSQLELDWFKKNHLQ